MVEEGDRVPADAILLWSTHLTIDESLLTGESVPVRKRTIQLEEDPEKLSATLRPGGDDLPTVYSGTLAVQGQGIAQVQATGIGTEMGKIGKALQTVEPEDTVLQKETRRIVGKLTMIALAICAAVVVIYRRSLPFQPDSTTGACRTDPGNGRRGFASSGSCPRTQNGNITQNSRS